jgi:hypothetical protein
LCEPLVAPFRPAGSIKGSNLPIRRSFVSLCRQTTRIDSAGRSGLHYPNAGGPEPLPRRTAVSHGHDFFGNAAGGRAFSQYTGQPRAVRRHRRRSSTPAVGTVAYEIVSPSVLIRASNGSQKMDRKWWQDCLRGVGAGMPDVPVADASHLERCPFCGRMFDMRELGQVLEHYDHQLAAGVPAGDLAPEQDKPPGVREVIPFHPRLLRKQKP